MDNKEVVSKHDIEFLKFIIDEHPTYKIRMNEILEKLCNVTIRIDETEILYKFYPIEEVRHLIMEQETDILVRFPDGRMKLYFATVLSSYSDIEVQLAIIMNIKR